MSVYAIISVLAAYLLFSRWIVGGLKGTLREALFAAVNLASVYAVFFYGHKSTYTQRFVIYIGVIVFQYVMLRIFGRNKGWTIWIAFFTPISFLVFFRYLPAAWYVQLGHHLGLASRGIPEMIGISYMAFRCSRLVLEVRNGTAKMPGFLEYLNFSFFLPTIPVGPINTYGNYRRGFEGDVQFPVGRAALRVLVGFVKYQFLGPICNQLTYSGLLLDDHPHHLVDLPVAILFYYLFLYCNFSGFCDMAIGGAGLIGIPVPENFQDPFFSRNMREFWNRWHITLSQWMRDIVFAPLSKYFARILGPERINLGISLTILIVFLLIGIWHGPGWNYAVFGLLQGVGVIVTHFYTLWLKARLGREGFQAYNANRWIRAAAIGVTFCYYAITLFFFANSPEDIAQICHIFR